MWWFVCAPYPCYDEWRKCLLLLLCVHITDTSTRCNNHNRLAAKNNLEDINLVNKTSLVLFKNKLKVCYMSLWMMLCRLWMIMRIMTLYSTCINNYVEWSGPLTIATVSIKRSLCHNSLSCWKLDKLYIYLGIDSGGYLCTNARVNGFEQSWGLDTVLYDVRI